VFTARYALSPYIKQKRLVFKGLILPSKQYVVALRVVQFLSHCSRLAPRQYELFQAPCNFS
jgi:hypothetical protein